jgi:hypothetical protein
MNTGHQHELGHAFGIAHLCMIDASAVASNFMRKQNYSVTIEGTPYSCTELDEEGDRNGGFLLDPIICYDLTKVFEQKPNNTYAEGDWWDYSQVEVIMNHAKYYELELFI